MKLGKPGSDARFFLGDFFLKSGIILLAYQQNELESKCKVMTGCQPFRNSSRIEKNECN